MHTGTFAVLPAVQLAVVWAVAAQVQAEHIRPSPKNPALHVHVDVSFVVLREHVLAFVAYGEHVLHAEHAFPSP